MFKHDIELSRRIPRGNIDHQNQNKTRRSIGYNDPAKTPANIAKQIVNQSLYQDRTPVDKYLLTAQYLVFPEPPVFLVARRRALVLLRRTDNFSRLVRFLAAIGEPLGFQGFRLN